MDPEMGMAGRVAGKQGRERGTRCLFFSLWHWIAGNDRLGTWGPRVVTLWETHSNVRASCSSTTKKRWKQKGQPAASREYQAATAHLPPTYASITISTHTHSLSLSLPSSAFLKPATESGAPRLCPPCKLSSALLSLSFYPHAQPPISATKERICHVLALGVCPTGRSLRPRITAGVN